MQSVAEVSTQINAKQHYPLKQGSIKDYYTSFAESVARFAAVSIVLASTLPFL